MKDTGKGQTREREREGETHIVSCSHSPAPTVISHHCPNVPIIVVGLKEDLRWNEEWQEQMREDKIDFVTREEVQQAPSSLARIHTHARPTSAPSPYTHTHSLSLSSTSEAECTLSIKGRAEPVPNNAEVTIRVYELRLT